MIRTDRLILRRWRESDREPFAALNADPVVMEHMQGLMSRERSDAFVDRIEAHWDAHGWGLWAVRSTPMRRRSSAMSACGRRTT